MTQPLGIDDFFVLEATEYLDRLAALASGPHAPGADELVRFTRALRGSALMANQPAIARSASGLEQVVRGLREGRRTWDEELGDTVREAVDMLRTLVERVRSWTPDDTARAERLALQLEATAGSAPRAAAPAPPLTNETGVRAFLARESAALASVLDQAAKSLIPGVASPETLQAVLRRMQPLRGLAALADFPPLPDVLDGIERTVVGMSRLEIAPASGGARLDAAARALSRAARDIADRGRPDAEAADFRRFAELLLAAETAEPDIVPIETLFFAGDAGVVQLGTAPRSPAAAGFGAAAIVSRGEHLCQSADEIADAGSVTQRDLRLHVLIGDLRTLGSGLPPGLDIAVEAFGSSARSAVARGAATRDPGGFAAVIRDAGTRLRGFTEVTQPTTLIQAFEALSARLEALVEEPAAPTPVTVATPVPAAEPVAMVDDESDVVPIESLAPDEPPAVSAGPSGFSSDAWDLAASYARLEELTAGAAGPAAAEAPATRIPVRIAAPEPAVVDIAALCYSGRAALERADQVRREILARGPAQPTAAIQPLVDELLDLVELALVD